MANRTAICTATLGALFALVDLASIGQAVAAEAATQTPIIRVAASEATSRFVPLGIGKSVAIDQPADIKDVLVADPKVANAVIRSSRRVYIIGVAVGQTNIFFFDADGRQIAGFDIAVKRDLNGVRNAIKQTIPGADIHVEGVGDGVMLSGSAASQAESQQAYDLAARLVGDGIKVVNGIAVRGRDQVMLKVTVAEVRRDVIKQLGIDLSGQFTITHQGAEILRIIGRSRVNTLVSGGTGSGKTTLLNCLTRFIDHDERIITCEDAAELQLQQPHVVRLETRPPNLEGEGQVTMRDLVRNCLRMRPERIIVGEVRGPEAFDLLQAMNTGHDGSMGTLHANNPREALSRLESMITMGGFSLPSRTIREMICASVDVVVQAARLRDGSRKITHITEVMGMEGDVIVTQDIFLYDMEGEDAKGNISGRHRSTGIGHPRFWDRARYYGEEKRLAAALDAADAANEAMRA